MTRSEKLVCSGSMLAIAMVLPNAAWAQASPESEASANDNVIIVTARKQEEQLVDVPNAITAFAPETIEDLRLNDARDLLQLVPTAYLQENNAGTARDISIRGVSTPTLFAEAGVATYIDEVYSSGFISYPTQFRDIERVEVLRGPQGALYGRNAVGGAVNVISARPDFDFSGRVRGTIANLDRYEIEGTLNVPLGDVAALRVLGWHDEQNDGEFFNVTTNRFLDSNKSTGGRLSVLIEPSPNFEILGVVETEDAEAAGTYLFFPDAGETPFTIRRDTQPSNEFDSTRYSINANLETDIGTFTLVFGGRDYELNGVEDTDLSDSTVVDLLTGQLGQQITTRFNSVESTSIEGRWRSNFDGPFGLFVGVNYLDESAEGDILTNLQGLSDALAGGLAPFTLGIENNQDLESFAIFAEATLELGANASLIASGRYTEDDKSVDFIFTPTPTLIGFVGPGQSAQLSRTFDNFSPGLTLTFEPSDTLNLYAKVQTGFRAGGFNFNVANAANLEYQEETSVNYEVGAKKAFGNGGSFVAASVFYLTQDDVLVPVFDFTAPPGLQGFLINAGEAKTFGAELEFTVDVGSGLRIQGGVAYLNGEFSSGSITNALGATVDLDGLELPASRNWTGSLIATYETPITDNISFVANGSFSARSSGFQDTENLFEIGGNALLNASAGIKTEHFEVLGFAQNITNDRYDIAFGGFRPPAATGVIQARGTTYGVTATARF